MAGLQVEPTNHGTLASVDKIPLQMTMATNNTLVELVNIAAAHSFLQTNLTELESFDGTIPVNDGNIVTTSPNLVDLRSRDVSASSCRLCVIFCRNEPLPLVGFTKFSVHLQTEETHTDLYQAANGSWANIQSLTEVVNVDPTMLRDRVIVSN